MAINMKTAAAYLRVSDERQDEFSPDSQLKLIKEYCKKNGINLPDELIFYDDGISAKTAAKRKQFNEMIALAKLKEKPFQMILVWKFSRFARNQEESIVYKSLLRKNGVEVVSVSEPLSDNPFGGLIERIIEWMDEYYLIRLSDEVRRGMTERATRGLPNAAPPFGYKMKDGQYEIIEEEAVHVRKIFEMFINKVPVSTIAKHFRDIGVRNKNGNSIDYRGIMYILSNPCYSGYVRWNPNHRAASVRKFDDPSTITVRSTHTPIIDEETFAKAKAILAERARTYKKGYRLEMTVHKFMLKGLVRCNTCGGTLVYLPATKGMQCHNYSRTTCPVSHYVSLDKLNKLVINELKKSVNSLSFRVSNEQTSKLLPAEAPNYDAMISAANLKLERAKQAYQEGVDSLNEYRAAKERITKEITRLREQQAAALSSTSHIDLNKFSKTVSDVLEIIENPNSSEELKRDSLAAIIEKIVYNKPDCTVDIFYRV